MARVRDIELAEVPEDLQPVYQRFAADYGPFLNQVKVFAHRPPALKHIMGLLLDLADEALLPKRYLEIALVVVSKLNECTYCVAHHTPRLVEQGLAPESVANILEPEVPGFDAVDLLVRDYAVQVTTK
ncbi:MAG: carboxymuconolactone decarboxylase family protein, partial [Kiloniellales bacterium]|nr:carboxymuconolactone decarboxylase family protein [Kiloniellales bacterium]